jgi:exonuclease III
MNNIYKVIRWNPNGLFSKLDEIKLLINKYDPIALCIQESNFSDNKINSLKNYTTYYKNRTNAGRASGEVATYINYNYHSELTISNFNILYNG